MGGVRPHHQLTTESAGGGSLLNRRPLHRVAQGVVRGDAVAYRSRRDEQVVGALSLGGLPARWMVGVVVQCGQRQRQEPEQTCLARNRPCVGQREDWVTPRVSSIESSRRRVEASSRASTSSLIGWSISPARIDAAILRARGSPAHNSAKACVRGHMVRRPGVRRRARKRGARLHAVPPGQMQRRRAGAVQCGGRTMVGQHGGQSGVGGRRTERGGHVLGRTRSVPAGTGTVRAGTALAARVRER
jgi:hypothetical protein